MQVLNDEQKTRKSDENGKTKKKKKTKVLNVSKKIWKEEEKKKA